MRRAVEAAVAAVAVLACAWFALGIHQNDDGVLAAHIATLPHPSVAEAAHAQALLRSAHTLNPDQGLAITRARLVLARGDAARARAILRGVVRSEPDDLDAWIELARASDGDSGVRLVAFAHMVKLTHTRLPGH